MLSSRWPTRNELNSIFEGSLSHDVVSGLFPLLNFTGPLHIIMASYGILCVNECVSASVFLIFFWGGGLFFFCLFFCPIYICLFLFYLILLHFYSFDASLFSKEMQKCVDTDGRESERNCGDLGRRISYQNIFYLKIYFVYYLFICFFT